MANYIIDGAELTAIADAIRDKVGTEDTYTTEEMATAIAAIESGGGGGAEIPEEAFVITGNCQYRFYRNGWNWFIENYGNQITTKDITNGGNMFSYSNELVEIPFDLNYNNNSNCNMIFSQCTKLQRVSNIDFNFNGCSSLGSAFHTCNSLKEIGTIKNLGTSDKPFTCSLSNMFSNCYNLRYLPVIENVNIFTNSNSAGMFNGCYSLRTIPEDWMTVLSKINHSYYGYSLYYQFLTSGYVIDEVLNIPVDYYSDTAAFTSNAFLNAFFSCHRIKNITFATNEDGSAKIARWKSQTIDLTTGIGWCTTTDYSKITNYNSGITADKLVSDDATYQALKDDTDWFTTNRGYSRYNHDSAVATINSLPDTSAYLAENGGTNTIKFTGAQGELTDGGAINTLTEEEIAVATAKGWTVTLV